ncbi:unnamed protein product [Caenorhabditis brenneri]
MQLGRPSITATTQTTIIKNPDGSESDWKFRVARRCGVLYRSRIERSAIAMLVTSRHQRTNLGEDCGAEKAIDMKYKQKSITTIMAIGQQLRRTTTWN